MPDLITPRVGIFLLALAAKKRPGPIPEVALKFLKRKKLEPSFDWNGVWKEEHNHAFTVAKIAQESVLADVKASLESALEEGIPFSQWAKEIKPMLDKAGWSKFMPESSIPHRLNTIFATNMRVARAAGQWDRIERARKTHPYLQYVLGPSHRHRQQHVAFAGLVLPVDDPFWKTHMPPNGFGCKCSVRQVSVREAERLGVHKSPTIEYYDWKDPNTGKVHRVPVGCDPGWDYNPGIARKEKLQEASLARVQLSLAEWKISKKSGKKYWYSYKKKGGKPAAKKDEPKGTQAKPNAGGGTKHPGSAATPAAGVPEKKGGWVISKNGKKYWKSAPKGKTAKPKDESTSGKSSGPKYEKVTSKSGKTYWKKKADSKSKPAREPAGEPLAKSTGPTIPRVGALDPVKRMGLLDSSPSKHSAEVQKVKKVWGPKEEEWKGKLTQEEHKAVEGWKHTSYSDIRDFQRGKIKPGSALHEIIKEKAEKFDKALAKAPTTDEPLFRGMRLGDNPEALKKMTTVGQVIQEDAHASWSPDPGLARAFSGSSKHLSLPGSVVLAVAKSSKARVINSGNGSGSIGKETEAIIPKGTKMRVKSVTEKAGVTLVEVEEVE